MTDETEPRKVTLGEHHVADITQQEEHAQDAITLAEDNADASRERTASSDKQLAVATEQSRVGFKGIKYILWVAIVCLLLMIFVSILAWSTVRTIGEDVRSQTETLVEIAETNRANSQRLIDCTTPEGECFQQNQARTGEVVGSLNATTIAAVYCAKALPAAATLAQVQACTEQALAEGN